MKRISDEDLAEIKRRQLLFAEYGEAPGDVMPFEQLIEMKNRLVQELTAARSMNGRHG